MSLKRRAARLPTRLLIALTLLTGSSSAQTKLNGPLARQTLTGIRAFHYSPDSTAVVYVANARDWSVDELLAVPADQSSAPLFLSGNLVAGGNVNPTFAIAPDSSTVYYLADAATDDFVQLYSVPIDGSGSPFLIASPLQANGDLQSFELSPDGSTIVFLADAQTDERKELYRVPADGSSAPILLSPIVPAGGDVSSFSIGAASSRVYYLADALTDGVVELFSRPLDASQPAVRLNAALSGPRSVVDFRVDAGEARVAFRADGVTDEVFELFSSPADGSSAPVKLNPTPVSGGDVSISYAFAPDGSRVAYLADQDTDAVSELYSVPSTGSGAPTKLSAPGSITPNFLFTPDSAQVLFSSSAGTTEQIFRVASTGGARVALVTVNGTFDDLFLKAVSPDGSTCLYDDQTWGTNGFFRDRWVDNLWVVPLAGGTPLQLTFERLYGPDTHGLGFFYGLEVLPDWSRAVYAFEAPNAVRLASVRLDGSQPPVILSASQSFHASPDGTKVAYVPDLASEGTGRLQSVAPEGGLVTALSSPPLEGEVIGGVTGFQPTPDGLQVVFGVHGYALSELFVTGVGGGHAPRSLTHSQQNWSYKAGTFTVISPTSNGLVFALEDRFDPYNELFWAPLRAPGEPVAIGGARAADQRVSTARGLEPLFSPDGAEVVFARTALLSPETPTGLFVAPTDGSVPARRVNGTLSDDRPWSNGFDRTFMLTPDGERVVYTASGFLTTPNLFSVPLDGSSPPVKLSQQTRATTAGAWRLTSDGSRVVYVADEGASLLYELFSAPVDGSSPRIKLNPTLVSGGDVRLAIESDPGSYVSFTSAGRMLYLADQEVDETWELYAVSVDGSAPATKLSGTMVSGGNVDYHVTLTPDRTRVLYFADAETDGKNELFSVPSDGSGPPMKLSGTLVAGGNVRPIEGPEGPLRFGGNRVVYVADALVDGRFELFSAPLDGSSSPTLLSGAMVAGGDVLTSSSAYDVLVTRDGTAVVYAADALTDDVFELFRAPIDGSAAPARLNLPMASGGDVEPGARLLSSGRRLLWLADQEADQRLELFSLELMPHTPRGPAVPPGISGTVTRQL